MLRSNLGLQPYGVLVAPVAVPLVLAPRVAQVDQQLLLAIADVDFHGRVPEELVGVACDQAI